MGFASKTAKPIILYNIIKESNYIYNARTEILYKTQTKQMLFSVKNCIFTF